MQADQLARRWGWDSLALLASHFSRKENRCYVLARHGMDAKSGRGVEEVYDGLEGFLLATNVYEWKGGVSNDVTCNTVPKRPWASHATTPEESSCQSYRRFLDQKFNDETDLEWEKRNEASKKVSDFYEVVPEGRSK
jgi:hypothetical protein